MPPATLSRAKEAEGLMLGNRTIEKLRGRAARGYRSPSWDLSPHTIELLLEQGFDYNSSMMGDDHTPYRARRGDIIELEQPVRFGEPTRLVEMPISWSLDDYPHFEFVRTKETVLQGLMATGGVLQNWLDDFLYMTRTTDWGVLTYTFHPCVIGRGHRMMMLERSDSRAARARRGVPGDGGRRGRVPRPSRTRDRLSAVAVRSGGPVARMPPLRRRSLSAT